MTAIKIDVDAAPVLAALNQLAARPVGGEGGIRTHGRFPYA